MNKLRKRIIEKLGGTIDPQTIPSNIEDENIITCKVVLNESYAVSNRCISNEIECRLLQKLKSSPGLLEYTKTKLAGSDIIEYRLDLAVKNITGKV